MGKKMKWTNKDYSFEIREAVYNLKFKQEVARRDKTYERIEGLLDHMIKLLDDSNNNFKVILDRNDDAYKHLYKHIK